MQKNTTNLAHHIDGTHNELIKMPIFHQLYVFYYGLLHTRPDLASQILFNVKSGTQV